MNFRGLGIRIFWLIWPFSRHFAPLGGKIKKSMFFFTCIKKLFSSESALFRPFSGQHFGHYSAKYNNLWAFRALFRFYKNFCSESAFSTDPPPAYQKGSQFPRLQTAPNTLTWHSFQDVTKGSKYTTLRMLLSVRSEPERVTNCYSLKATLIWRCYRV